jgi:hypothetical protein
VRRNVHVKRIEPKTLGEAAHGEDFTVSDSEAAEMILRYLGFAVEPSLEPYMDRKRDRIARMIRAAIDADRHLRNTE